MLAAAPALLVATVTVVRAIRIFASQPPAEAAAVEGSSEQSHTRDKRIRIIVGSNSGTAELCARILAAEGRQKGFIIDVVDAGSLAPVGNPAGPEDFAAFKKVVCDGFAVNIFVVATYGEGEPTESCKEIHSALKSAAKTVLSAKNESRLSGAALNPRLFPFEKSHFAVFGLGDSSYKYFARAGIEFADYVRVLGGELIVPLAKGDARNRMEDTFDEWKEALWEPLAALTETHIKADSDAVPHPEHEFNFRDDLTGSDSPFPSRPSAMEPSMRFPFRASLVANEVLVEGSPKDGTRRTLRVAFDISKAPIAYQGGDHLGILPCNPETQVERALKALRVMPQDAGRVVELTTTARQSRRATKANVLPNLVSLREALRWYVALCATPKKSALRTLAKYCPAGSEQRQALTDAIATPDAFTVFVKKHRTIVDVLESFPDAAIPVGHFLEIMPRIAPRYYSIATDMSKSPDTVGIIFVVAEGGLCTNMLNSLRVGDTVHLFVRHSTFHLSQAKKTAPVLMIGAGTGAAPFVGFAERREVWKSKQVPIGECRLYFGCRREMVDYFLKEQWCKWLAEGVVTHIRAAFSRDDPSSKKKYVQHVVADDAQSIYDAMEKEGGFIYICGDAAGMAAEVEQVLIRNVLSTVGGMSEEAAARVLAKWERTGRYIKDVWSSAIPAA